MAQASGGYSSYPSFVQYVIDCWIAATDSANNRSLVSANAYVYVSGSSASSAGGSGDLYINGSGNGGSVGYWSRSRYGTVGVVSHSVWVSHNANGQLGDVSFSGSSSMNGLGDASASGSVGGFPDYDRKPGYCSSVSASRSGTSYTVYAGNADSPAGTPTYYVERSENGGGWTGQNSMPGQQYTYTGLNKGLNYQFRVWATNSDGTGPVTNSAYYLVPAEPAAPSSLAVSDPVARSVTITAGTATNNGASVTGYYVQFSTDAGTSWSTAQAMTAQAYTYTNLDGGLNYLFRAYATNEMGNGAVATSGNVFVPSGGKRWNETAWVPTVTSKRWNGTTWVNLTVTKRWNGTEWVNLA